MTLQAALMWPASTGNLPSAPLGVRIRASVPLAKKKSLGFEDFSYPEVAANF